MFILSALSGALLGWLMGFLSLFLILLVLVQRGKGGGLTGALGGPGGQSAFGSKAGDTFTVITVVVASIWGFTCAFTMWLLGTHTPAVTLKDTNISAGPGDEADAANNILIPAMDGDAADGSAIDLVEEIDVVSSNTTAGDSTDETPSMELKAADDQNDPSDQPDSSEPDSSEPEPEEPEPEAGGSEKAEEN